MLVEVVGPVVLLFAPGFVRRDLHLATFWDLIGDGNFAGELLRSPKRQRRRVQRPTNLLVMGAV